MVAMVTPFKKTKKKYQKFIFDFKANFYTKFEENLKTWTYHLFSILHEPYVNLYLTSVSCNGSNRIWRQRLLLPAILPMTSYTNALRGVIRPLVGGKCRTLRRVIQRFLFHLYLCFHCVFCVRVFGILFYTDIVTMSY